MNMLNQIIIKGDVMKAEVEGETTTLTLATTIRNYKEGGTEVSHFDVIAPSKMCPANAKGHTLRVVGYVKQVRWTTVEGKHCSKLVVIAEKIDA